MFEEGIFSIMNSVWMIHFENCHRFSVLWLYLLISLTDMSEKLLIFYEIIQIHQYLKDTEKKFFGDGEW